MCVCVCVCVCVCKVKILHKLTAIVYVMMDRSELIFYLIGKLA